MTSNYCVMLLLVLLFWFPLLLLFIVMVPVATERESLEPMVCHLRPPKRSCLGSACC